MADNVGGEVVVTGLAEIVVEAVGTVDVDVAGYVVDVDWFSENTIRKTAETATEKASTVTYELQEVP